MKVLHFYKTSQADTIGGVEKVIAQLCKSGSAYSIDAEVLALSKTPSLVEIDGCRIHRAKLDLNLASTGFSWSVFKTFAALSREADLIHYHFPWPWMDVVHFVVRPQKPTLVTYHSDIIKQKHLLTLYQPLMNRFLSDVTHIVATSPPYAETSPVLSRFKEKVSVIPLGLDINTYPTPDETELAKWRKQLGERFFLFVGVLRYYKGLHTLLDALKGTNFPLVIVGNGPIEQELKTQVAELQLPNVHFLGALSDIDKVSLLKLCTGFVFPSHLRSEAFGLSLLESAMFGKPMISCDIGTGTSYINVDQKTGWVVPPNNADALRQAMTALWENPSKAAVFGEAAQERYKALFTADVMMQSYAELYHTTKQNFLSKN